MTGVGEGMRRHQFRERWGGKLEPKPTETVVGCKIVRTLTTCTVSHA
ncbi:conserved protein of unknown function [Limnospira indica PCC 8005]|uniref:Uncharacterized protein n=1 Tax=Limnospira indica PCC 8005 TaxID=376219 RepID=A0A9P1KH33_9CYAN|nr:conserved protein of unknown function [Limnospira indica PCC 8005]